MREIEATALRASENVSPCSSIAASVIVLHHIRFDRCFNFPHEIDWIYVSLFLVRGISQSNKYRMANDDGDGERCGEHARSHNKQPSKQNERKIKIETFRLLNVEANVLVMRIAYFGKSNVFSEHTPARSFASIISSMSHLIRQRLPFPSSTAHRKVRCNFDVATG